MGFDGSSAGSDWLRLKTSVSDVMPILPDVAKALQPLMLNTLFFEQVRQDTLTYHIRTPALICALVFVRCRPLPSH